MSAFKPSLRIALTIPFVILFTATVIMQAATQQTNATYLIEQESARLLDSLTEGTRSRLALLLEEPFRVQLGLADAISRHDLYRPGDMRPIYDYLEGVYRDLYADQRQVSVIAFGGRDGTYAGIRRESSGALTLMLKDQSTQDFLDIYTEPVRRITRFDPRQRPWYEVVASGGKPTWSVPYANLDEHGSVTVSAVAPVRRGAELLGVVAVDVKLEAVQRFLRDDSLRGRGMVFITDHEGRLLASSATAEVMLATGSPGSDARLPLAAESDNPLIRSVSAVLRDSGTTPVNLRLREGDEVYVGRVAGYADGHGLDWRIVTLMPEHALLGDARKAHARSMVAVGVFAGIGLLIGLWVIGRITRPILDTAQAADRLARGEWDARLPEGGRLHEISALVHSFNEMVTRLQRSFNRLHEQLMRDDITHLLTRRGLLDSAARGGACQSVLVLVGLDAFRAINNGVGHDTGDRLLVGVAERLRRHVGDQALLARVGGDEFAVLYRAEGEGRDGGDEEAMERAQRVLALFALPFVSGEDEVLMSASAGVVSGVLGGEDLGEWLRNASVALSEAKRRGRAQCVMFEVPMMARSVERTRLINDLRHALDREEFVLFYQPVMDLRGGGLGGVEALVRWNSPERGLLMPDAFIPVAEETDLILGLGDWVLRTAIGDFAALQARLPAGFDLHVNVSVRQLLQSDFVGNLETMLRDSGLPPCALTLEITESLLMGQDSLTEKQLNRLRATGVRIAIDDFGTGYSSLAYLHRLPVDCLKIDKSFVRNMTQSPQDAAIVAAVLEMAQGLGVCVVAEGIETPAELALLHDQGCQYGQGYHFGRPVPLDQLDLTLRIVR